MIAESIEKKVPLIPALQAFGAEYGSWRGRARRLANALANGIPLPEALRLVPDLIEAETLPIIEAGSQAARLNQALRRASEQNNRTEPIWQALAGKLFYLVLVVLLMSYVWVFISLWVVPRFNDIFYDFEIPLPMLTRQMIEVSEYIYVIWPLLALVVLASLALFIFGALCYVGVITCDLPLTRRITRRLDTAIILDALSLTTESERPMPEALTTLAARYPKPSIRRRLRNAWLKVADGQDWCESLVANRLLNQADAGLLQSAIRTGNLPWAMREMADSNRRRFAYRLHAMLQIVFPAVLGTIGLVVCFYVVACFLPLIELIKHLSC